MGYLPRSDSILQNYLLFPHMAQLKGEVLARQHQLPCETFLTLVTDGWSRSQYPGSKPIKFSLAEVLNYSSEKLGRWLMMAALRLKAPAQLVWVEVAGDKDRGHANPSSGGADISLRKSFC